MTVIDHKTDQETLHDALNRKLRKRLDRIDENRDVWSAFKDGKNQRQIAELLMLSQPQVHRLLRVLSDDALEVTPSEIIYRAIVNDVPEEDMVSALAKIEYTFGEDAPYPFEGRISGTWDEVVGAYAFEYISGETFEKIRSAVGA